MADCHNGRILKTKPGSQAFEAFHPLGQLTREEAWTEYHMNSMAAHPNGTLWVLLHNSLKKPSEIVVVNSEFEIVRRFELSAGAAHNIVFTNDELEYLVADSYGGRILSARRRIDGKDFSPSNYTLAESAR